MTIAEAFNPKKNSLNALRLVLATLVIVSHSWPLGGYGEDPGFGGQDLGDWAVAGFFVTSGFLIAGSRMNSRSFGDYLWRRFLRIYPAFVVVLLAVAFIFAPLSILLDGTGAYSWVDGALYVVKNLGLYVTQLGIDGTLTTANYPYSWDGPLWTLAYEFACYIIIGALISVVPRRYVGRATIALFAAGTFATAVHVLMGVGGDGAAVRLVRLATYFAAGSIIYLYRERIPTRGWVAGVAGALVIGSILTGTFQVFAGLPLAYVMLYAGIRLPLSKIGRKNDISYGMYIYAFPIQQLIAIATAGTSLTLLPYVALSIVLTVPFAWASWLAIERPAMSLKRLSAGRRSPTDRIPTSAV